MKAIPTQRYLTRQASEFERTFGVPLSSYWCPLLGFNITGFDDQVVKSGARSVREAVQQTYGSDAVRLIESLLDNHD